LLDAYYLSLLSTPTCLRHYPPKEPIISADQIDFRSKHHCDSSCCWIDRVWFALLPRARDASLGAFSRGWRSLHWGPRLAQWRTIGL